jgi:phosphatidylinositol glycan class B
MRPPVLRALQEHLPGNRVYPMVAAAAAIAMVSAWFNQGFFSHDEHFQILEFAWHKLRGTPADGLAWEFQARMRPGLQPWVAAGLISGLQALGLFTPFATAFLLRLISGFLGLWISLVLCLRTMAGVRDTSLKPLLLAGTLFLWFLPYTHGRFASENWGGLLFFGGLCLLIETTDRASDSRWLLRGVLAGLLWGAAFYCRFQIGLAIAGAGAWLLLVGRVRPAGLTALAASFILTCALNTAIDHWLYGVWVVTPFNYFNTNIVQGKAATFGTEPWWFYLAQLLGLLVPPFSVLLLGLLAVSVWLRPRDVLVWTVVPFVAGHTLLAHKEVRFMIPMTYALVPLLVLGADSLPAALRSHVSGWRNRVATAAAGRVFIGLNLLALAVMMFKPSSETAVVYSALYDEGRKAPVLLYTVTSLPYNLGGDAVDFYRPGSLTVRTLRDAGELRAAIDAHPGHVFFFQQSLQAPLWMVNEHIACTPVAQTLPPWAARFNLNNWTSRMYRWSVFSVTARAERGGC